MKLIDNDLCDICSNEIEDIMHLFVKCTELYNFHMYVSKQVEELFENCDSDQKNYIVYEEIFILGLNRTIKGVNVNFINFMLSVARYCVFRRRNLVKNNMNSIDIIRLFKYTLKHYVVYFYEYLCQMRKMRSIFDRHFLQNNTIVQETNNVILFNL
jgi:hypothetical protein